MLAVLVLILLVAGFGLPRVLDENSLIAGWTAAAAVAAVAAWLLRPAGRRKRP